MKKSLRKRAVPAVALLTDFGFEDPFVGIMKGVLLQKGAKAPVIDLTHNVPPQDVRAAALHLWSAYAFFPVGTLFVVVVDPGVGTERRVLLAESPRYRFLGPDNGVLSWALGAEGPLRVWSVENQSFMLETPSATFHGRDVFAPVAGAIVKGVRPERLGPQIQKWESIPFPKISRSKNTIVGEVLLIDHFGNLITNLRPDDLEGSSKNWRFALGNDLRVPLKKTYGSVLPGQPVAVTGSSGFIEISIRNGSAADHWDMKVGHRITVHKGRL